MLNQSIVVGRIVNSPELYESENGHKLTNVVLAVPRYYKNINGEYETDFIKCVLWRGVAERAVEYCQKGDLVGVRGRLQSRVVEEDEEDAKPKSVMEFVGEKLTFLQTSKNNNSK